MEPTALALKSADEKVEAEKDTRVYDATALDIETRKELDSLVYTTLHPPVGILEITKDQAEKFTLNEKSLIHGLQVRIVE